MGTLKRATESGNGHARLGAWTVLTGLGILAGCAICSWVFIGQSSNSMPMERAIEALDNPGLGIPEKRAALARIHFLAKQGVVAMQRLSTGDDKPAEDARIYLQKLQKVIEGR